MHPSIRRCSFLCFAALLLACRPLGAQTYVFQQNDVGQTVTNADGFTVTYPDNNLWTQPYTTGTDTSNNPYVSALTNWTAQTSLLDAAGVTAVVGSSAARRPAARGVRAFFRSTATFPWRARWP